METLDLVVVGSGIAGLAAAKTYHQLNPEKTLAILEAAADLGGVWTKGRLYPGLKSNNMLGTYEYPDFPMDTETFGVKSGEHIPGIVMYQYLAKYAEKFDIADKIRYQHKVLTAEHQDSSSSGGWILTVVNNGKEKSLRSSRLILATGLTSEPFLPDFRGQESFGAPLFQTASFQKHACTLDTAKSVTVFGGTKSAWDAVYAYATRGIKVDWVIRETGHGPIWQAPPYVTPLKKWLEKLVNTRMLTWFSPCIWGFAGGYNAIRDFYHGTAVGRAIANAFWSILGNDVITLNKYDSHPETKKLKPWSHPMFTASSFSILNYPTDFFDLVRDGTVKVHIADITHLSPRSVHLSDGTQLPTDLLCCATGWKHVPPVRFFPDGIDRELGLPHDPTKTLLFTKDALEKADDEILSRFPRLRDQPVQNPKLKSPLDTEGLSSTDKVTPYTPLTPFILYHFMIPPTNKFLQTRDIAFAGYCQNFSTAIMAHVQALWITAFFDDQLPGKTLPPLKRRLYSSEPVEDVKSLEAIEYETVLYSRFGKWRYPAGRGAQQPDFVFDALPYLDLLVSDLGLKVHRKKGWFAELSDPYGPEDYRDLVGEFVDSVEARKD
ncbi:hypothetical protein QBC35DRAFT_97983 [Podospora australis]|uniref:Monooxygenase n=1 Tax=Podospora australis TaxID=1536484 RepID=A0AAN7ADS1_9PEZI|nr:hypothetical protein QBC35DRAFT_97983 [Podospora australis]